jgi:hypothetical protein
MSIDRRKRSAICGSVIESSTVFGSSRAVTFRAAGVFA